MVVVLPVFERFCLSCIQHTQLMLSQADTHTVSLVDYDFFLSFFPLQWFRVKPHLLKPASFNGDSYWGTVMVFQPML